MPHPNSLANLTHKGRSPLPYDPIRLQVPLDPALVAQIDQYKTNSNIKTKNGRNRAIAQLIELGLAIAPLMSQIEQVQYGAQIDSLEETLSILIGVAMEIE